MTTAEYNQLAARRNLPPVGSPRRQPAPRIMNKWEREYSANLALQQRSGEIEFFAYEPIRLRLADGAWYKPDFLVIRPGGKIEFHEVKGFERSRDVVRFKVAGDLFPFWRFVMVSKVNGAWQVTREAGAK